MQQITISTVPSISICKLMLGMRKPFRDLKRRHARLNHGSLILVHTHSTGWPPKARSILKVISLIKFVLIRLHERIAYI